MAHLLGHGGDCVPDALGVGAGEGHEGLFDPGGVRDAGLRHLAVAQDGGRRRDGSAQVLEARDVVVCEAGRDGVTHAFQCAKLLHSALSVGLVGISGGSAQAAAVLHDLNDLRNRALAHALDARGHGCVLGRLDLHPPRLKLANGLRANGGASRTKARMLG